MSDDRQSASMDAKFLEQIAERMAKKAIADSDPLINEVLRPSWEHISVVLGRCKHVAGDPIFGLVLLLRRALDEEERRNKMLSDRVDDLCKELNELQEEGEKTYIFGPGTKP